MLCSSAARVLEVLCAGTVSVIDVWCLLKCFCVGAVLARVVMLLLCCCRGDSTEQQI